MKITLTILLASLLVPNTGKTAALTGDRPNILFIIADDQSPFDLKIYNPRSALQTPNIDRLAAQGMVIDGAHHMGSWVGGVCTASRHMIMSGRTLWHVPDKPGRIMNPHVNNPKMVPPNLVKYTLPAVFNRAGYDTMRTCKNGNSYADANELFQVRRDGTRRGATDERGSAWHAEQVLAYLNERESAKDTDPFLIYFGFSHPHDVRDGKPELLAKYGAVNHDDKTTPPSAKGVMPRPGTPPSAKAKSEPPPFDSPLTALPIMPSSGFRPAESAMPDSRCPNPRNTSSSPLPPAVAACRAEVRAAPNRSDRRSRSPITSDSVSASSRFSAIDPSPAIALAFLIQLGNAWC